MPRTYLLLSHHFSFSMGIMSIRTSHRRSFTLDFAQVQTARSLDRQEHLQLYFCQQLISSALLKLTFVEPLLHGIAILHFFVRLCL